MMGLLGRGRRNRPACRWHNYLPPIKCIMPAPSPVAPPELGHRGLMFADSLLQQKARTGKQGCDISSQGGKVAFTCPNPSLSLSVGGQLECVNRLPEEEGGGENIVSGREWTSEKLCLRCRENTSENTLFYTLDTPDLLPHKHTHRPCGPSGSLEEGPSMAYWLPLVADGKSATSHILFPERAGLLQPS